MNSTEMYGKCMRNVAECLQDRTPGALPERRHAVRLRCGTVNRIGGKIMVRNGRGMCWDAMGD